MEWNKTGSITLAHNVLKNNKSGCKTLAMPKGGFTKGEGISFAVKPLPYWVRDLQRKVKGP